MDSNHTSPPPPTRRMSNWTLIFFYLGIILNIIVSAITIYNAFDSDLTPDRAIGFGLTAIISLTYAFGLMMLLKWKRYGFWILCFCCIANFIIGPWLLERSFVSSLWGIVSVAFYWALLQTKTNDTKTWNLLEPGGGFKVAKGAYAFFFTFSIAYLILTMVAGFMAKDPEGHSPDPYADTTKDLPGTFPDIDTISVRPAKETEPADSSVSDQGKGQDKNKDRETPKTEAPKDDRQSKKPETRKDESQSQRPASGADEFDPTEWNAIVRECRSMLPIDCGNGVVMNRMSLNGRTLTYNFIIDESIISIDALRAQRSVMKNAIRDAWRASPETKMLLRQARKDGVSIRAVMRGDRSNDIFSLTFSPIEL